MANTARFSHYYTDIDAAVDEVTAARGNYPSLATRLDHIGGVSDYDDLTNKPSIAGVTLTGDTTLAALGIASAEDFASVAAAIALLFSYIHVPGDATVRLTGNTDYEVGIAEVGDE